MSLSTESLPQIRFDITEAPRILRMSRASLYERVRLGRSTTLAPLTLRCPTIPRCCGSCSPAASVSFRSRPTGGRPALAFWPRRPSGAEIVPRGDSSVKPQRQRSVMRA